MLFFFSFVTEAHRALELLEEYHAKLTSPQDKQLRAAIERVIGIFKSRLFQALLGKFFQVTFQQEIGLVGGIVGLLASCFFSVRPPH